MSSKYELAKHSTLVKMVDKLEAENAELRKQIEDMQVISKSLALRSAQLDPVKAENAELRAELKAIKKLIQDKYKNANKVFGLGLGKAATK